MGHDPMESVAQATTCHNSGGTFWHVYLGDCVGVGQSSGRVNALASCASVDTGSVS
jgi:hypothetical protein